MSFGGDPELWFHSLGAHYLEVQILYELNRSGVIQLLAAEGPQTPAGIAERLGLTERVVDALLRFVAGVDDLLAADAEGRFGVTPFGRKVLDRFGRQESGGARYNLFDVRAGAYAPVWAGIDALLHGAVYGVDVKRAGELAEEAVYKLSARIEPKLRELVARTGARQVVELGVMTGLLDRLAAADPTLTLHGVDRSARALEKAAGRSTSAGVAEGIRWIRGDVFLPEEWMARIDPDEPGILFSIHFHEFVANAGRSPADLSAALAAFGRRFPGWRVVSVEQPLLTDEDRRTFPEAHTLFVDANVLIHHLVGTGRILPAAEWEQVLADGGLRDVRAEPMDYLCYLALVGEWP